MLSGWIAIVSVIIEQGYVLCLQLFEIDVSIALQLVTRISYYYCLSSCYPRDETKKTVRG